MTTRLDPSSRLRPRTRWVRRILAPFVGALGRSLCAPLTVTGMHPEDVGSGPILIVSNHASHLDTVLLGSVFGPSRGWRIAPAAAEDYFFSSQVRALISTVLIGAIAFPRRGMAGLSRCNSALQAGTSVVLYPQGTRGGGAFRPGVGILASRGWTIVPVALVGTDSVLGKGSRWPKRGPVSVTIGQPMHLTGIPATVATRLIAERVDSLSRGTLTSSQSTLGEAA